MNRPVPDPYLTRTRYRSSNPRTDLYLCTPVFSGVQVQVGSNPRGAASLASGTGAGRSDTEFLTTTVLSEMTPSPRVCWGRVSQTPEEEV